LGMAPLWYLSALIGILFRNAGVAEIIGTSPRPFVGVSHRTKLSEFRSIALPQP